LRSSEVEAFWKDRENVHIHHHHHPRH
jgi:hypothetical protein